MFLSDLLYRACYKLTASKFFDTVSISGEVDFDGLGATLDKGILDACYG